MKQLYTIWGERLDPEHVLPEYPRPQMVRNNYLSLNGRWECCWSDKKAYDEDRFPEKFGNVILVPFSPESALSGVRRQTKPDETLWYHRKVVLNVPEGQRVLLHFGAVDQSCRLFVNNFRLLEHVGGYLPFTADITNALVKDAESGSLIADIVLAVRDLSDTSCHARGKQKLERGGMFYTAVSGIWQSVWIEYVPEQYISGLKIVPDADAGKFLITVNSEADLPVEIRMAAAPAETGCGQVSTGTGPEAAAEAVRPGELLAAGRTNCPITVEIPPRQRRLWSCEDPYLYYFDVLAGEDRVRTYAALRCFTVEKRTLNDGTGRMCPRLCLNHKVVFQKGVLDQGYWPDGIYTAPSDEAMIFDLTEMKKTGFNMVRKHIKIEPDRWYYHCDRLGLIVWQDMVNGGGHYYHWFVTYTATILSLLGIPVTDRLRVLLSRTSKAGREEFSREVMETIAHLYNHPGICTWVIFNEGWGQFSTNRLTKQTRSADPTRLIDQASGWFDQGGGDFLSIHNYFFKQFVRKTRRRAFVLTEFGGSMLRVEGHSFSDTRYGYGENKTRADAQRSYKELDAQVQALVPRGMCASVYTQWTDVEDEVNGIYTYDRKVRKIEG